MDRISVCEGYYLYYVHWHAGGRTARCERQGRGIAEQLHRMKFQPGLLLTLSDLKSDERECAREVYLTLVRRHEGELACQLEEAMLPDPCAAVP